jgi:hypothetical protein
MARTARGATLAGVAFLVGFHGWLFAGRLAEGELLEPAVALRWLASAVLVAALEGLRRAGVPLVRGRRALVFWVLVLLLHWSATPLAERRIPVDELLIAAPGVITLAAGVVLLLGTGGRARRTVRPPVSARRRRAPIFPSAVQRLLPVLAARPPPA